MRKLFSLCLLLFPLLCYSQASTTGNFEIIVQFDRSIPVDNLDVSFYKTNGQEFNTIHYSTSPAENSIKISGSNSYIIGTSFPTLLFSYKTIVKKNYLKPTDDNKNGMVSADEPVETTAIFYLITGHYIGSYDEPVKQAIRFSKTDASILVEKEAGKEYKVSFYNFNSGITDNRFREALSPANELIKINKFQQTK